jgi:exopolysaccharide production protein ExoZ
MDDGGRLQGLQAARAIAALSVAYFHSYVAVRSAFPESAWMPIPWLKQWGFLGLDFFFAISGFVICLVATRPSFTLPGFIIKRIFRIYPMYWVTMAMIVGLIARGQYAEQPLSHFLYSLTLLPQSTPPAYEVSWTLERELVFYLLAALIVPIGGVPGLAIVLAGLATGGFYFHNPWSFHLVRRTRRIFCPAFWCSWHGGRSPASAACCRSPPAPSCSPRCPGHGRPTRFPWRWRSSSPAWSR